MEKDISKNLTNNLSKSELKELERLSVIFGKESGKKFESILIEKGSVMGRYENRLIYLGTKEDYNKYMKLKHKK